jgi:hypothetical protein
MCSSLEHYYTPKKEKSCFFNILKPSLFIAGILVVPGILVIAGILAEARILVIAGMPS